MALGGWLGTLADPGGLRTTRAAALGTFAVLGAVVLPLSERCASSAVLATLLVAVVAFGATLVRALGPAAATVGTMIAIVAAVGTGGIGGSSYALDALAFAGGATWAILLSSIVWPVSTHRPVRVAIAAVYESLAAYAGEIAESAERDEAGPAWTALALRHHRLIRARIEEALAIALAVRATHPGESAVGSDLRVLLGRAEAQFPKLIAVTVELEAVARSARPAPVIARLRSIVTTYTAIGRTLVTLRPTPARATDVGATDRDGSEDATPTPAFVLATRIAEESERAQVLAGALGSGMALVDDVDAESGRRSYVALARAMGNEARELRDALSPRSVFFRHALRVSLAVAVASFVGHRIAVQPHWVTVTTLAVLQPYPGPTSTRAMERVVGTVFGCVLAAVITMSIHAPLALALLMFPLSVAAVATRARSYRLFTFFLTPVFVLIAERHPGDWWAAVARAGDSLVGGVIALLAALVVFPSWERTRLPDAIDRMAAAALAYRDVVLANLDTRGPEPDAELERGIAEARRAAGIAIGEAETSLERWMAEPLRRPEEGEYAMQAVTHARRLTNACTTLDSRAAHRVSDDAGRAQHMRALAAYGEALVALVARASGIPALRGSGSG